MTGTGVSFYLRGDGRIHESREHTCVVGGVVVGVQEPFDRMGAAEQGMLGNRVQIRLQSSLPLCYKLPVHVSDQFFRWERESDATHL